MYVTELVTSVGLSLRSDVMGSRESVEAAIRIAHEASAAAGDALLRATLLVTETPKKRTPVDTRG